MKPIHKYSLWTLAAFVLAFPARAEDAPYKLDMPWANYRVFQWEETRARFGLGLNSFHAGTGQDTSPLMLVRYRLSPEPWPKSEDRPWHLGPVPLRLWAELGGIPPHTGSSLLIETKSPSPGTTDRAEVKLNWQGHAAIGAEVPIGRQRVVVPEAAVGLALASLNNSFRSESRDASGYGFDHGDENRTALSPYFRIGLHLFPDHVVSLSLSAARVHYSDTFNRDIQYISYPQNSHPQTFDFGLSGWQWMPLVELKLLWPSAVHVPVVPQALPPWLLPSYTTEPISPWVAPPSVANDPRYKGTGNENVGNVMFQYRNAWVDKVELIGDFNDWTPERMIKDRSGIWVLVKDLPVGKFRYNYLINGKKEIRDPWNSAVDPDSRAHGSSIVTIK